MQIKLDAMIPIGYMAKRIASRPVWLNVENISDIYSVSDCTSEGFLDDLVDYNYENDSRTNGWYFFDSPQQITSAAKERSVDLKETLLFYYEAYQFEFDEDGLHPFGPEPLMSLSVVPPAVKKLEGFDVVTFSTGRFPECSPLSCNSLATEIATNSHCLLRSFEEAEASIRGGAFRKGEPGPHRILAVHSVAWP